MELEDLPWWNGSNSLQYLPKDMLEERIKQVPLTIGLVKSFLDNYISKFVVFNSKDCWKGRLIRDSLLRGLSTFYIMIDSNLSLEEKAETLVHETFHGIYRVNSTEELEPLIEEIAGKFYREDKDLFNSLVDKYLDN